jgi:hypothetical protein
MVNIYNLRIDFNSSINRKIIERGLNMLDNLIKKAVTKVEDQKELEKLVPKVSMEVLIAAVYEKKS